MMELYVEQQAGAFFGMILCGIGFGLVFDFFRAIRKIFPMNSLAVSLSDLLFWLICAGMVFGSVKLTNRGELRMFSFLGFFSGITAYFLVFGSYVVRWMAAILRWLLRVIIITVRILWFPFRLLSKPLSKLGKKGKKVWKKLEFIWSVKRQKRLLNRHHLKKIIKSPKFF